MLITKADGTREEFKANKLRSSLRRAGASRGEIHRIVTEIESSLTEGMKTQAIYRKAFTLLRESTTPVAAKYSLRRAVFNLGPTGFPFEDFLARLFESDGYQVKKRILIKGHCATHEIDVAAYKPERSLVVEAKFHSRPGIKSDLQVALYSYARFLDLKSQHICREDMCGIDELCVVTNTKFTRSAIKYAECTGVHLVDWNYPKNNSLMTRIENAGFYPVTVLTALSTKQKQMLLAQNILLCRDLLEKSHMLDALGLSEAKKNGVLDEAALLCHAN